MERLEQIAEMRERGLSCELIGRSVGISGEMVHWECLKHGIESPNTKNKVLPQTCPGPIMMQRGDHVVRRYTPDEDRDLMALEAEGLTYSEIGRRMGRSRNSVHGRIMTLARQEERR